MNPSQHARQILREYAHQREREKRWERVKRAFDDWAWLPISVAAVWALWFLQ